MSQSKPETEESAHITVERIGGIDHADEDIPPGLTILSGRNATNRSSFIDALNAALGGERAYPHAEVPSGESGRVELEFGESTYTRTISQPSSGTRTFGGEPYSNKQRLVDLYATLTGDNEIRSLIASGTSDEVNNNLRRLLMAPVDDADIRTEKRDLQNRKQSIQQRIEDINDKKQRLPGLEAERQRVKSSLEDVQESLNEKREQIEAIEVDKEESDEAKELLISLRDARNRVDHIEEDIERTEQSLETAREERDELAAQIDEITTILREMNDVDDSRIDVLRERKSTVDTLESLLEQAQQINRRMMNQTGNDVLPDEFRTEKDTILDELTAESEQVNCWACGSAVSAAAVSERTEDLSNIRRQYRAEKQDIEEEIDTLQSKIDQKEAKERELQRLKNKLSRQEELIEERTQKLERLEADLDEQQEQVDQLEKEVAETEELRNHKIVDVHEEVRELSQEQGRLETKLSDTEQEIEKIEKACEEEDALSEELEEITERIKELNGRVTRIEKRAQETLQEHLDKLVDVLDYDNVARIRIERKVTDAEDENQFTLSVVRETSSGAVSEHQNGLQTLSESERSLVGLVVALAGYQTHTVAAEVPMLLLDSIEEFDSQRINRLLTYLSEEVPRIIAALLPEDTSALESDYCAIQSDTLI